jgi:undecaprenyl diphosphate synthase
VHSPSNDKPGVARYVAIITDGNSRWAHARGLDVSEGHDAGADTLKARLRDAAELGVQELTVYSFSTENWSRPQEEVDGLIAMMARRIAQETPELHEEGVRMRFIGRRDGVPAHLLEQMDKAEGLTDSNQRITLCIAFNYGGRAEILDAARSFAAKRVAQSAEGRLEGGGEPGPSSSIAGPLASQSDEEEFSRLLYAPDMHDPELLIRTGKERRLSNFVLWQAAYSEIMFRDELWPDFSREALEECLREFSERRRRFGGRKQTAGEPHHDKARGVTTVSRREE